MIQRLDVSSLLLDAPASSVRQTVHVERLEDELLSEPPSSFQLLRSSDSINTAIDTDYDAVSEQVFDR